MNKKLLLVLLPLASIALTGCGEKKYAEHLEDYVRTMTYHDKFNILQLTDIHWNNNTSTMASKRYLEKTLAEADRHIKETQGPNAKIDLIELTGDQFMLANAYHIGAFIEFFEAKAVQYGFQYASIWGNHDRHGIYNPNYLADEFRKAEHSIYVEEEDDLYGRSNFVINLTADGTKNSATKWQLANLDSGASFSESAAAPFRDYDYIRPDQTEWWIQEHNAVGKATPAIAYYHIPQDENLTAWNDIHKNGAAYKHKFFKLEGFGDNGNPQYASDFLDRAVDEGHNLKGAFMGHAHNVDWTVEYQGVVLGLGVKTGPELYYAHIDPADQDPNTQEGLASVGINEKFDLIGASLVTLVNEGGTFELEHLYLNERASGDFVRWVKW
ncbi:MAG: metallophosphoesterase [Bacilli bacterium]|nr:metallophosphoesterase [Bacilli bacterium]